MMTSRALRNYKKVFGLMLLVCDTKTRQQSQIEIEREKKEEKFTNNHYPYAATILAYLNNNKLISKLLSFLISLSRLDA